MFSVIFEVQPVPAHLDTYLDLAMRLKPEAEAIDGFLSVERFTSRNRPGWVLSLQFWRDDAAIARWRTHELHHRMQERGRQELFQDYRLRVGPVIAEAESGGLELPPRRDDGAEPSDRDRIVVVLEAAAETIAAVPPLPDQDVFDSLYNPGRSVLLGAWPNQAGALAWQAQVPAPSGFAPSSRLRLMAVARDYGMSARAEAPQHFPKRAGPQRAGSA